jgi:hypothetical protein
MQDPSKPARITGADVSRPDPLLIEKLLEISNRCAALPVLDSRTDDEIVGYDEFGGFS